MNYYNTEIEHKQSIYIEELETSLNEGNIEELTRDRIYIIELAKLMQHGTHKLETKDIKKINKQLIELI